MEKKLTKRKRVRKILKAMDNMTPQEWKNLKSFFNYTFSIKEKFKNNKLAVDTVYLFFNSN